MAANAYLGSSGRLGQEGNGDGFRVAGEAFGEKNRILLEV